MYRQTIKLEIYYYILVCRPNTFGISSETKYEAKKPTIYIYHMFIKNTYIYDFPLKKLNKFSDINTK